METLSVRKMYTNTGTVQKLLTAADKVLSESETIVSDLFADYNDAKDDVEERSKGIIGTWKNRKVKKTVEAVRQEIAEISREYDQMRLFRGYLGDLWDRKRTIGSILADLGNSGVVDISKIKNDINQTKEELKHSFPESDPMARLDMASENVLLLFLTRELNKLIFKRKSIDEDEDKPMSAIATLAKSRPRTARATVLDSRVYTGGQKVNSRTRNKRNKTTKNKTKSRNKAIKRTKTSKTSKTSKTTKRKSKSLNKSKAKTKSRNNLKKAKTRR